MKHCVLAVMAITALALGAHADSIKLLSFKVGESGSRRSRCLKTPVPQEESRENGNNNTCRKRIGYAA